MFTKELDRALLEGRVDICVHSMKDVETALCPGTCLPAMLPREDTRDAFIGGGETKRLDEIEARAIIGTASLRRAAQIKARHPSVSTVNFRGNVQTRLRKLKAGEVDGTLLAYAGLKRMGMERHATHVLSHEEMLPAVAQGAIGIQCRKDDQRSLKLLGRLNHPETKTCVDCERAFLAELDGNCRTPIAAHARFIGGGGGGGGQPRLRFEGLVALPDGTAVHRVRRECAAADACEVARDAARELKRRCGPDFFRKVREAGTGTWGQAPQAAA